MSFCLECNCSGEPQNLLITVRGADGTYKTSGPEFEAADREFKESWKEALQNLKDDRGKVQ